MICLRLVLFGSIFQPFGVHRAHERTKDPELGTEDPVVACVCTERLVGDRTLAAHCAIEAIEPKRFPGIPVELMPGTGIELDVRTGGRLKPFDIRLRGGKFVEPILNFCGSAFAR